MDILSDINNNKPQEISNQFESCSELTNESDLNIIELCKRVPTSLEQILNFIPRRQEIALTCKAFYEVVCRLEAFKFWLNLESIDLDNNFQSIVCTQRRFNKLFVITPYSNDKLDAILQKFGSEIVEARIENVHALEEILKWLPNLEKLTLVFYTHVQSHNVPVTLYNLKKLSLQLLYYDEESLNTFFFKSIPAGVLQDCEISVHISDKVTQNLFNLQGNIKKLKVSYPDHLDLASNLQLEEFSGCGRFVLDESSLVEFVRKQPKLIKLTLDRSIRYSTLKLCSENLHNLQALTITLPKLTPEKMYQLSQLHQLKVFSLAVWSFDIQIEAFAFEMPSVSEFTLKHPRYATASDEIMTSIKKVFPNLISLTLENVLPLTMNVLLHGFRRLETAKFIYIWGNTEKELPMFNDGFQYENLKELSVNYYPRFYDERNEIFNWIKALPNLKVLKLYNAMPLNDTLLNILKQNKSIKKLLIQSLRLTENFEVSDLLHEVLMKLSKLQSLHLGFTPFYIDIYEEFECQYEQGASNEKKWKSIENWVLNLMNVQANNAEPDANEPVASQPTKLNNIRKRLNDRIDLTMNKFKNVLQDNKLHDLMLKRNPRKSTTRDNFEFSISSAYNEKDFYEPL